MAINHAETSILIDGVDTRNMSDITLSAKREAYSYLLEICPMRSRCDICEKREIQLDVINMELNARQEKGFTFAKA